MDVPVSYLTVPADLVNEAIDMLGEPGKIIGDITDGTVVAEAARRYYGQGLRQLLRSARWDFARKRVRLQLLGDASGNTPPLGVSPYVECPWRFCYEWPVDALLGLWLPWTPTSGQPVSGNGIPLTTGNSAPVSYYGMTPGRYLVSASDQYPVEVGSVPWDQLPDFQRTSGVGPTSRKVILTDCCDAEFVYIKMEPTIEVWDALFRQAMVTMLAIALAPVAIEDPKLRIAERDRLIPILRNAVSDARVANNNENAYPQSTDFEASFIRARNYGWWGGNAWGDGLGGLGYSGMGESFSWGGSVF